MQMRRSVTGNSTKGFLFNMAKDTFYFSHDYNARNDDKIKSLLRKHGMSGYGIFWAIVEELYNNANALRTDYDCIAYDLRTDEIIIKSIIEDFDLFQISEGFFGSCSIEKRLDERNEKSKSARLSAFARWNKKNATALPNDANAQKSDAIKESIVNKVKEKKESITFSFKNSLLNLVNDEILVSDFLKVRKSKKAVDSETAFKGLILECEKNNFNLSDALKICCERNWVGFKYDWIKNDLNKTYTNGTTKQHSTGIIFDKP